MMERIISKIRKSRKVPAIAGLQITAELEELHQKQKAIRNEELLKAIENSSRSYAEILEFIQNGTSPDEELQRG